MNKLITFKTFENPVDAHILKSRLEDSGIEVVLHDENMLSLNVMYNLTLGGIKLKIREEDVKKALEIFHSINDGEFEEVKEINICPNCEYENPQGKYKSVRSFRGFLAVFLAIFAFFGTPPMHVDYVFKCPECGYVYKEDDMEEIEE
jgi:rubredoxin